MDCRRPYDDLATEVMSASLRRAGCHLDVTLTNGTSPSTPRPVRADAERARDAQGAGVDRREAVEAPGPVPVPGRVDEGPLLASPGVVFITHGGSGAVQCSPASTWVQKNVTICSEMP